MGDLPDATTGLPGPPGLWNTWISAAAGFELIDTSCVVPLTIVAQLVLSAAVSRSAKEQSFGAKEVRMMSESNPI
jgi:hypothetical protein